MGVKVSHPLNRIRDPYFISIECTDLRKPRLRINNNVCRVSRDEGLKQAARRETLAGNSSGGFNAGETGFPRNMNADA